MVLYVYEIIDQILLKLTQNWTDHRHESGAHLVRPDVLAGGSKAVDDDLGGSRHVVSLAGPVEHG